jgi:hypothetical protein
MHTTHPGGLERPKVSGMVAIENSLHTIIQPGPETSQTLLEETGREHLRKTKSARALSNMQHTHSMLHTQLHQGRWITASLPMFNTVTLDPFFKLVYVFASMSVATLPN